MCLLVTLLIEGPPLRKKTDGDWCERTQRISRLGRKDSDEPLRHCVDVHQHGTENELDAAATPLTVAAAADRCADPGAGQCAINEFQSSTGKSADR